MANLASLSPLLNVRVCGTLSAPRTLVFSHGFGTDQTCWHGLLPFLEKDYRIVLLDHAGSGRMGRSLWDPKRYSRLNAYSEDLVRLLGEMDLHQTTLVGHSAGALIALMAAINAPERIDRLVLIAATACYRDDAGYRGGFTRDDLIQLYGLIMTNYREWIGQFVPRVTGSHSDSQLHRYLSDLLSRFSPEDALVMATAVLETDYRDWASLITQPTLLLQARDDSIVPPDAAEFLRQNIPNNREVTLPTSGHFPFFDLPEQVAAEIRAFA